MYFYFIGFRCCYCNFWNPARKQKPSISKPECNVGFSSPSSTISEQLSSNTNVEQIKLTRTESIPSDSGLNVKKKKRKYNNLNLKKKIIN